MTQTLGRYFGTRFLVTFSAIFAGVFGLVMLIDYLEMMRRHADIPNASALLIARASLYRVPQIVERILPFAVLIAAMSCFLGLSRRLELVIARSAGVSAWQFTAPALMAALAVGAFATGIYNPVAAILAEQSKRMEAELAGRTLQLTGSTSTGIWLRQRGADGQSIMNAATSREQGIQLGTVTVFTFDHDNRFLERIEAKSAKLEPGQWRLESARIHAPGIPPSDRVSYLLSTNLTAEQVQETFSTPETVPFWQLPEYIVRAENAGLSASAFRLQYQKLLARPFLLAAMVVLAAAFSLRFFRFGGVQKMVLGGVASGFLIYVVSKLTDDLSKAELMNPVIAAWLPTSVGGLAGFLALLHQEDG
jgi:lipopolysaccharide export system permease protein